MASAMRPRGSFLPVSLVGFGWLFLCRKLAAGISVGKFLCRSAFLSAFVLIGEGPFSLRFGYGRNRSLLIEQRLDGDTAIHALVLDRGQHPKKQHRSKPRAHQRMMRLYRMKLLMLRAHRRAAAAYPAERRPALGPYDLNHVDTEET